MVFQKLVIIQILAFAAFFVDTAAAAPLTFNVDGVISDSTNQPLESASVTFTVQVKDSTETCLLYQETFPVSMTGSNGYFSLVVGKQTNGVSGGTTLDKVFSNASTAIPGQSCTYTPSSTSESRKIVVSFNDGSGSQVFTTQEIQSVPYAVAASEAAKFTGALSGDVTGSQTTTVVAKIQGKPVDMTGIADGKILKYQSGSFVVADDATGTSGITSLNGLTATSQSFSAIDLGNSVLSPTWVSSTASHTLKIPMASGTGVTAGLISNSEFAAFSTKITALTGDVTASGVGTVNATIGTGKVTSSHILDGTVVGADMDFTATNSATSDLVLKDSGTGKFATFTCATPNYVLTWTASGWACQAPATTGLPLTGGTMSGAISMGSNNLTNVGNLTMVPGGYLLLPNTATNGTLAGQVWYDSGVIKYWDGSAAKTLSTGSSGMSNALSAGQVWVGNASGGAEARSLTGDITSVSSAGSVVVNKTTTGTANTILSLDGTGVATMSGVSLVNTGTVTVSAGTASSNYGLKLPAASPTGNQVMQVDALGNLTWIATPSFSMPALNDGLIWIGNSSNGAAAQTMGGDATISNSGVLTLKNTGTIGTYYKVMTDAQGRVTSGSALVSSDVTTALTYVPLKKAGDTMSGDLGTQNINMAANTYLKLSSNSTDGSVQGQMWYDSGIIKYYDGSTVKSLGVAGAGITSLNGLTSASQTFVTGTSGTDFNLSFSGITHTFNLPSASATNRGALTAADWNTFNSKQSNTLASGNLFVGNTSGGAQARVISGDITMDSVGFTTLKNTGTVGTYTKVITDAQGRVTSGLGLASGDVTAALGYTPSNGVGSYTNGGNSFGAAATLGTNDANTLSFKTNSTTRMVIDTNGKVGIGSGAPSASLDMSSQTDAIIMPKGATGTRPGSAVSGMIRYNTTNNTVEYYDGTSWLTVGSALGYTPVNKAGDAMTGALAMGANDITNTGSITMAANKYFKLSANSTDGVSAGQMWYDSGIIKYFDGTTVKSLGVAGAGITSLNGLTTGTQTFGNGTAGNLPNWSSTGSGHTLNIPMANTTSVTAGLISKAEYDTFNSKQSTALGAGQVWVGNSSGASEARVLSGDIASVSGVGLVTVDKTTTGVANKILSLDGTGVANIKGLDIQTGTGKVTFQTAGAFTNYVLTLPTTSGNANQVLQNTGGGNLGWATVLTPSSINNNATLGSGKFWVGNASGAATEVAMTGDATMDNVGSVTLNTVSVGEGGTGSTSIAAGSLVLGNGTSAITTLAGGTSGNVLFASGASTWASVGPDAAGLVDKTSTQTISGSKTFSGAVGIQNGTLTNTSISLGAGVNAITAANGNITAGSGGTSVTGGGQMYAGAYVLSSNAIDFNKGNTQSTSYDCTSGNINLTNMHSGGNYTLIVTSTTTAKCTLQDTGVNIADAQFTPTNSVRTASVPTVYKLTKIGSTVYAQWGSVGTTPAVGFLNNGNTFGGNASIGITDAYNLNLMTNATVRMTINSAGNVGIGTQSPASSLDLSAKTDAVVLPKGATASRPSTLVSGMIRYNTTTSAVEYYDGGAWYSFGKDLGFTPLNKAGDTMSGVLGMNSNNITSVNMIGIGTTSPNYSLDFTGKTDAIRLPSGTTVQQPANAAGLFRYNTTTNNLEFNNGTAWNTVAVAGAATLPAIASAQVWIGNSSGGPEARALSGDVTISPVGLVTLKNTGTVGTYTKVITDAQGRVVSSAALASGDVTTALGFTPANNSNTYINGGSTFAGNATIGLNDAYNLGFETNNVTRMTLTSTGNLGIGTTTPGTYRTLIQGTAGTDVLGVTDGTATAAFYIDNTSTPSAPVQFGTTSNHSLGFFTNNNNPSMTLSTGGNLGIGLDAPAYSLDISGKTDAVRLPIGTTAQRPTNASGLLRYNSTTLSLEFNNGSAWSTLGVAGAGITSLNGLTSTTQTFGTGTTGNSPNWNSSGSGHILHIPMANTTSVTAGLISKTEYDTFNSKMGSALTSGSMWVGNASNGAQAIALSGDVASVSPTGVVTINKTTTGTVNTILSLDGSGVATAKGLTLVNTGLVSLSAATASSTYGLRLPASSPNANQIMVSDASGNLSWQTNPSLGYTPVNKAGDTMTGTLEVSGNIQTNQGQVYASQNVVASGSTVDFNTGNVQVVQSPGGASITLNNMKDGGSYTVIITDTTSRQYTFNNCTNQHFVPANDLTTASTHSIYTILKITISSQTHCYISWVTGF